MVINKRAVPLWGLIVWGDHKRGKSDKALRNAVDKNPRKGSQC